MKINFVADALLRKSPTSTQGHLKAACAAEVHALTLVRVVCPEKF
jgi:hypothetical protein